MHKEKFIPEREDVGTGVPKQIKCRHDYHSQASKPAVPAQTVAPFDSQNAAELSFKGIPYEDIIREWWPRNGGEPQVGERNVKLHSLAVNLRAICDNNPQLLMQIMPRYGLSESEMASIVASACKEVPKGISSKMLSIIKSLSEPQPASDEAAKPLPPSLSLGKLPIGLKESLSGLPANMQMPVLCSLMPLAATYADRVEAEYCDGKMHRLGLMTIIRGEQASGKSVCKTVNDIWLQQFKEEDIVNRQREDEWKEAKRGRKATEKAPVDPKVLIRVVPITTSCSTLLRRLKNANGRTIYSFCEEIDTLTKTNGAGSWSSKYDVYRIGFDGGEWGQDYNSDQAESGIVNVNYNWTALGTNGAVGRCFRGENIENGLSSRILVSEMPDTSFAKLTKQKNYTEKDIAAIQEAVTRLRQAHGELHLPRLCRGIEEWLEVKRLEASKVNDRVKDIYRRRSAVIAFRSAVVFHILKGSKKESKACLEFAKLMADYCLEEQMKCFGHALRNQYENCQSEQSQSWTNKSIYDMLNETFTKDDLKALKPDCSASGLRTIIMRWKKDGLIIQIGQGLYKKTS